MKRYLNQRPGAAIHSIEFAQARGRTQAFVTGDAAAIRGWFTAQHFTLLAEVPQQGRTAFVAETEQTPEAILDQLRTQGESFTHEVPKKEFQGWKWRGGLSLVGQSLDVLSVHMANRRKSRSSGDNVAYLLFALFNIAASLINITLGAKKVADPHREHYLKTQLHNTLARTSEGKDLPSPETTILPPDEKANTSRSKLGQFMRSHSVYLDIALRTFGNMNLIFPVTRWGQPGWHNKLNDNAYSRAAGISLMAGKLFTLSSKVPDPYNPEPPTKFDRFRETATFRLGNTVEAVSPLLMGYNSFAGTKNAHGVRKNNPASGIANVLFLGGYGARFFAPFGVREINLKEIEAYAANCIAQAPLEKRAGLLAEISIKLKEQLRDQRVTASELYDHLSARLNAAAQTPSPESQPADAAGPGTRIQQPGTATPLQTNEPALQVR